MHGAYIHTYIHVLQQSYNLESKRGGEGGGGERERGGREEREREREKQTRTFYYLKDRDWNAQL